MRRLLVSLLLSVSVSLPCWAGASMEFTGASTDAVDSGQDTPFDGLSAFTLAIWCYRTGNSSAAYDRVMGHGITGDTAGTYSIFIGGAAGDLNKPYGEAVVGGVKNDVVAGSAPSVNTWYHHAVTWGSNSLILYVNGVNVNSAVTSGSLNTNTYNFTIGAELSGPGNNAFPGQLAYASVYNRVLSVDEINQIMWKPGSIVDGLIAFWPLYDPEGTSFIDLGPNGYTGTENNSVVSVANGPPVFITSPLASLQQFFNWIGQLLIPNLYADEIILCDPTTHQVTSYTKSDDPYKSGAISNLNSLIWSLPPSKVNPWDGVVPSVAQKYWKCDSGKVIEMTQTEKDVVDAPALAQAALQAKLSAEIAANPLCTIEDPDALEQKYRDAIKAAATTDDKVILLEDEVALLLRCDRARR